MKHKQISFFQLMMSVLYNTTKVSVSEPVLQILFHHRSDSCIKRLRLLEDVVERKVTNEA